MDLSLPNSLEFKRIPRKSLIKNINNDFIQKIYSKFSFDYVDISQISNKYDRNIIKSFLFDSIKEFKFITYNIDQTINNIKSLILCAEANCYIIDSLEDNIIYELLEDIKVPTINIGSDTKETIPFDEV